MENYKVQINSLISSLSSVYSQLTSKGTADALQTGAALPVGADDGTSAVPLTGSFFIVKGKDAQTYNPNYEGNYIVNKMYDGSGKSYSVVFGGKNPAAFESASGSRIATNNVSFFGGQGFADFAQNQTAAAAATLAAARAASGSTADITPGPAGGAAVPALPADSVYLAQAAVAYNLERYEIITHYSKENIKRRAQTLGEALRGAYMQQQNNERDYKLTSLNLNYSGAISSSISSINGLLKVSL
jgi:hypothetical protein